LKRLNGRRFFGLQFGHLLALQADSHKKMPQTLEGLAVARSRLETTVINSST
jgi:hypothetical protein